MSPMSAYVDNVAYFRRIFDRCEDVIFRSVRAGGRFEATIVYTQAMSSDLRIERNVLLPLMRTEAPPSDDPDRLLDWLVSEAVPAEDIAAQSDLERAAESVLAGYVMLLVEGVNPALLVGLAAYPARSVEEPASEPVIRGSRDGFTESLQTNVSLIRRRLKTPALKIETRNAGKLTKTALSVLYLEGIASSALVEEVRSRLEEIRLDAVLESGAVEELIKERRLTVFPQLHATERPDRASAALAEGRVLILVDNSPFGLVAPGLALEMLQASEDYSQHYIVATATRWLRYWLAFSALVFPSLYIAITTMHQEMLPTNLLLSIASSREAVPFPAIVEAFIMEMAFEGLREAGVRLPRPVGQAVSIVGALVIGQAAVQAGLVSASLVIVVSFTGIASFIFPSYSFGLAVRLLRFPLMIVAGLLGLYGIVLFLLALLIHLAKMKSFGVPYLSPAAPLSMKGVKDVLMRKSWIDWNKGR